MFGLIPPGSDLGSIVPKPKMDREPMPRQNEWTIEEVAQAQDRQLAQFYRALDAGDRFLFNRAGIDIHRDFREEIPMPEKAERYARPLEEYR